MNKIKITQELDGNYYMEVSNDFDKFLILRIKLTLNDLENLRAQINSNLV